MYGVQVKVREEVENIYTSTFGLNNPCTREPALKMWSFSEERET